MEISPPSLAPQGESESTKRLRSQAFSNMVQAATSKKSFMNVNTKGASLTTVALRPPFAPTSPKAPISFTCFIAGTEEDDKVDDRVIPYSRHRDEATGHIPYPKPYGRIIQAAIFKEAFPPTINLGDELIFTGVKYSINYLTKSMDENLMDIDGSTQFEITIQGVGTPFLNLTASSVMVRPTTPERLAKLLGTYRPEPLTDIPLVKRYLERRAIAMEIHSRRSEPGFDPQAIQASLYPPETEFGNGKSVPFEILSCDGWQNASALIAIDNRLWAYDVEAIPEDLINSTGPLTCIGNVDRDPSVYVHEKKDSGGVCIPCLGYSKNNKSWTLIALPKQGRPSAMYGAICFQTAVATICSNCKVWPLIAPQIIRNLVGYMAIEVRLTAGKQDKDARQPPVMDCVDLINLMKARETPDAPAPEIVISGMGNIRVNAWDTFVGAGVMISREHYKEVLVKTNARERSTASIKHFIDSGDAAKNSPLYAIVDREKRVPDAFSMFPLFEFTGDIDHYFPETRWAFFMVPIDSLYERFDGKEVYEVQGFRELNLTRSDDERREYMAVEGWLTGAVPSAYVFAVARPE